MHLTKHHGLGNDFLIAVEPSRSINMTDAIKWCDRRRGIGADGLVELRELSAASENSPAMWSMDILNPDGSVAAVCGNGLRCVGQALLMYQGLSEDTDYLIRTPSGIRRVEVAADRRSGTHQVRADMGPAAGGLPTSQRWSELGIEVREQLGVSIGNPHLVAIVDDLERLDLSVVGPAIEQDFPEGVNIHFVRIESPTSITMKVWERGAGITQACGSGACAVAWAANHWGLAESTVTINMPGGAAVIELEDTVFLNGPATYIGSVSLDA